MVTPPAVLNISKRGFVFLSCEGTVLLEFYSGENKTVLTGCIRHFKTAALWNLHGADPSNID